MMLLHGFASSKYSTKALYFSKKFRSLKQYRFIPFDFNPTPLDFKYMTISGMIDRLRQHVLEHRIQRMRVIASSLGSLVALHFTHRYGIIEKMLLLAPALHYKPRGITEEQLEEWKDRGEGEVEHYRFNRSIPLWYRFHEDGLHYSMKIPPSVPLIILHGRKDNVVPIEESREYALQHPKMVKLIEVDSDHLLHDELDFAWQLVTDELLT